MGLIFIFRLVINNSKSDYFSSKIRTPRLCARFVSAMAAAMIFFVSFPDTTCAANFDFEERFPNNDAFEEKIRQANKACLPDPFPLIKHNYAYRFADGVITECVTENMTTGQAIKYSLLALASATTGPAGLAFGGYATGELSSDGMKCILKAYVNASSGMTAAEKQSAKSWIDKGIVLRDWNKFAKNVSKIMEKVPELALEHIVKMKEAIEAGAAAYERSQEAWKFAEAVEGAAGDIVEMAGNLHAQAIKAVSDYAYGETVNRIAEANQAVRDCHFDEALAILKKAYKAAQKECRQYGVEYRLAEVDFRSFTYRNRTSLATNNALFNPIFEQNPQQRRYPNELSKVATKRNDLARFSKKFNEIESLNTKLGNKRAEIDQIQTALNKIDADAGGGEDMCKLVLETVSLIDGWTPGCRDKLLTESNAQVERPSNIYMHFINTGRIRSQGWWSEVDRVREAYAACDTASAEARAAALKADIDNNPIFLIENGLCTKVDQNVLLSELAGLKSSANCDPENSLRILPRGLFVSRDEAGQERVSKAVAGQELFIQTNFGVSRLSRSDVMFVNLEAVFPGGRKVTIQTQNVPVSPENEGGYRATARLILPEDVSPGTCHITGRIRWGGLGADAGEASFVIEEFQVDVGELVVSPTAGGLSERKYAPGDPIHATVELGFVPSDSEKTVLGKWVVTFPDGHKQDLEPSETTLSSAYAAGAKNTLTTVIQTNGSILLGRYLLEVIASVDERIIASRSTTFEIVPLFENPTLLISNTAESIDSVQNFRPGDPLFVIANLTYNSSDPNRVVHVSVELTGPDDRIRALDTEGDENPMRGASGIGAQLQIPAQIMEGTYTAVVTLDGGHDQVLRLQESFRIVYPVQFAGIWSRDGNDPPTLKNNFANGDTREWFMQYQFVDVRPGDRFSSGFTCSYNGTQIEPLSSEIFGPDAPDASGSTFTRDFGVIPLDAPPGVYDLQGIVWYNDIGYLSSEALFKVGQDPTVTITSPQPGFEVDEKVLVVTGTCADRNLEQAQMITNGEAITIKLRDGAFSAKTVLRPGRNDIAVTAENAGGTSEASVWGTAHIQAAALKIVLSWEAQGPDIDLWVTDPQGVLTNYHHKRPAEGRNLDVDDTSGPGMETYTVEVPLRGRYDVAVRYFSAKGWQGPLKFQLRVTTWESTHYENHSVKMGTLYKAGRDSGKQSDGAVVPFSIWLQ